jgi:hypothetical protein
VGTIASREGLRTDWLNDSARPFAPVGLKVEDCEVLLEHRALRVLGPPLDFVFLMKLCAARAPAYDDLVALWPYCSFGTADEAVGSYRAAAYRGSPTAFVVGSEGSGLAKVWHEQGFGVVSIPMLGQADSLNVALSAGILLFEARARKDGW